MATETTKATKATTASKPTSPKPKKSKRNPKPNPVKEKEGRDAAFSWIVSKKKPTLVNLLTSKELDDISPAHTDCFNCIPFLIAEVEEWTTLNPVKMEETLDFISEILAGVHSVVTKATRELSSVHTCKDRMCECDACSERDKNSEEMNYIFNISGFKALFDVQNPQAKCVVTIDRFKEFCIDKIYDYKRNLVIASRYAVLAKLQPQVLGKKVADAKQIKTLDAMRDIMIRSIKDS